MVLSDFELVMLFGLTLIQLKTKLVKKGRLPFLSLWHL